MTIHRTLGHQAHTIDRSFLVTHIHSGGGGHSVSQGLHEVALRDSEQAGATRGRLCSDMGGGER